MAAGTRSSRLRPVAPGPAEGTTSLTVLYDESCAVCRRCRDWLLGQPCLVPVEMLPARSPEATRRYRGIPWRGSELVVVDQDGRTWVGPAAFIVCFWATARYRRLAYALSTPALAPLADRVFHFVSKRRRRWSVWLDRRDAECTWCPATVGDDHDPTT